MSTFGALVGETLSSVVMRDDRALVTFWTEDGKQFQMFHSPDCCESVEVNDICGDLSDLLHTPILQAEESESGETPDDISQEYQPESQTWTFYKLATIKGSVTIRWFGTSNGYYSESVDFVQVAP